MHGHGIFGNPQHVSSGNGFDDMQQHFPCSTLKSGRNRETLFSQWQPSHRQIPSGTAVLNSMATAVMQATHCRNESNSIGCIISSMVREVNNILWENPKYGNSGSF
jgi:hypothetical protein